MMRLWKGWGFGKAIRGGASNGPHGLPTRLLTAGALLLAGCSLALAQSAAILPNAETQFFNSNGAPIAGGTVTTYVPNTTTPKTSWQDAFESIPNANPVVLDSAGRAFIFGQGAYREIVKDSGGNLIWDSYTFAPGTGNVSGNSALDTAPVGTVVGFSGFTLPTNWQLAFGQTLSRSSFAALETALTISTSSGNCVSGSTTVSGFSDTSQMAVGEAVEASCLSSGTTVAAILSSSQIQTSIAATASTTTTVTVFPWGNGNGSTTFNVPDLRGRVMAGADAMGGSAASRLTSTFYGASASAPAVAGGAQDQTLPQTQTTNVATTGATSINGLTNTTTNVTTIPPTSTINYIIKVAANSSGLGGVTSIGGLFGDFTCGTSLTCSTIASVNTINCAIATSSVVGCVKPDGTTITVNGAGVIMALGTSQANSIGVGATTVSGGTNGNIEFNNSGTLGEKGVTGSGSVVLATGPTIAGTVNFTGTVQVGGTSQVFPGSGLLAGLNDAQTFQNALSFTGIISPSALASNTNNWAPAGFANAYTVRVSASAQINITGLAGGGSGRTVVLENVGANNITLTNQDSNSTAANRFLFANSQNLVLRPNATIHLDYDNTQSRWVTLAQQLTTVPNFQVFTSGTSLTYTTPTDSSGQLPLYLRVKMLAGGGGGGANSTNAGTVGNNTSFSGWTAVGGSQGLAGLSAGGAGGTGGTNGTGTLIMRVAGFAGQTSNNGNSALGGGSYLSSGPNVWGSTNIAAAAAGTSAVANTGAGGNGGTNGTNSGSGGGGGEYAEFIITSPAASYTYTVAAAANGGAAGGDAGGNGASGKIIVEAFWQ